jgi:hypothetical protein
VTTLIPHQLSTGLYVSITGGTIFDGSYQIEVVSNVAFQFATSIAGSINYPNAGTTVPATPQDGVFQPYGDGQGGGTGLGVAGAGYFTNGQYPDQTFPFFYRRRLQPKVMAISISMVEVIIRSQEFHHHLQRPSLKVVLVEVNAL